MAEDKGVVVTKGFSILKHDTGLLLQVGTTNLLQADSTSITGLIRTRTLLVHAGQGKAGATAGWTTAVDTGEANCAASSTAATYTLGITGLDIGDTITGFTVIGQIESGGNTATLDADLRALTGVAAEPTDASVGAITQVSVTADTLVSASKTGLSHTVATNIVPYILFTATTAASTDINLMAVEVSVTTA